MDQAWHEQVGRREEWEAEVQEALYEMRQKQIEENRIRLEEMGIIFKDEE